jgi:hypothetical protein
MSLILIILKNGRRPRTPRKHSQKGEDFSTVVPMQKPFQCIDDRLLVSKL